MNSPLIIKALFRNSILLLLLSILSNSTNAQGCDFLENDLIQLNISNQNTDNSYTQQYALISSSGLILDINSQPSFPPQIAGSYTVYALNYETSNNISGFSIGNNISGITGNCFDTTSLAVNVCACSTDCHSTDGTIVLSVTNANTGSDFTQSYALTDNAGTILSINTNPTNLNPLFSNLNVGNYKVYALNYETNTGVTNYTISNNIADISGDCLDIEGPICYNICSNILTCQSEDGTVSINNTGFTRTSGFAQTYALVDGNGIIQRIKSNPSTTNRLFIAVPAGDYQVYALNYEIVSGINNYSIGSPINAVTGSCLDIAPPISYKVCPCPFTGCNSSDGVISFNITGQNQTVEFTQTYVLTDTFGLIMQISVGQNDTDSIFESISTGYYHLYALNYETSSDIMGLSIGNSIADVSGSCFDITGAFCYQVCNDNYDFGDLPDNSASTSQGDYQTLLVNDGPRHLIINGLSLGDTVDVETDGLPDVKAEGDGTDEDGLIVFPSLDIVPGMNFRLPLSYVNTTGDTAFVEAWIDWNGDGDFADVNEMVLNVDDGNGTTPITDRWEISIPSDAITGQAIGLRIRISLQDNMTPYGVQPNGEVEDYLLRLDCPKICLPIFHKVQKN